MKNNISGCLLLSLISFVSIFLLPFLLPIVIAVVFYMLVFSLQLVYLYFKNLIKTFFVERFDFLTKVLHWKGKAVDLGELVVVASFFSYKYISKPMLDNNITFGEKCVIETASGPDLCWIWDFQNTFTTKLLIYTPIILIALYYGVKILIYVAKIESIFTVWRNKKNQNLNPANEELIK